MKIKVWEKINNIPAKIMNHLLFQVISQSEEAMQACKNHSTSMKDKAKFGMLGQALETAWKDIQKNPNASKEQLELQKQMRDWADETARLWNRQEFDKIDFECWQLVNESFKNNSAQAITALKYKEN